MSARLMFIIYCCGIAEGTCICNMLRKTLNLHNSLSFLISLISSPSSLHLHPVKSHKRTSYLPPSISPTTGMFSQTTEPASLKENVLVLPLCSLLCHFRTKNRNSTNKKNHSSLSGSVKPFEQTCNRNPHCPKPFQFTSELSIRQSCKCTQQLISVLRLRGRKKERRATRQTEKQP